MPENEYIRLTRSAPRHEGLAALIGRSSLWLGKDHLLAVDSNGYNEEYKRFHFRNIQTVTVALTKRRFVWNWLLGVPLGLCLCGWVLAFSADSLSLAGNIIFATVAALFAIPFLANNLLGPTCVTHLSTAVQVEKIPGLNRLRRAQKVLNQLHPLIVAAQADFTSAPTESPQQSTPGV
jgi:hypothetical protein